MIASSSSSPAVRTRAGVNDAGEGNQRHLGGAAADIDDHVSGRFLHRQADADRGGHRLLDQVNLAGTRLLGGFADGAALDLGDAGRDGDEHPRIRAAALVHLADEMAEHRLGDFEIRDDAVLQRADRDDIARRPAEHAFGVVADGEHLVGAGLDRHDRWLAQNDAVVLDVDQRVRGAEVDADIIGKQISEKLFEHGKC